MRIHYKYIHIVCKYELEENGKQTGNEKKSKGFGGTSPMTLVYKTANNSIYRKLATKCILPL
jgi:hypothetical protein